MTTAVANADVALELLPEGVRVPADVPAEVFAPALETFLACERLDMRALASRMGVSRATLYRRVGDRDALLGAVVWYLTRRALVPAIVAAQDLRGAPRVLATMGDFMRFVDGQPAFRRFLDAEPEAALRILTSKRGPVQGGIVAATEALLREEEARGMILTLDASTLAYVMARIGESFLYADVIAGSEPDIGEALRVIEQLIAAG